MAVASADENRVKGNQVQNLNGPATVSKEHCLEKPLHTHFCEKVRQREDRRVRKPA